jgi:(p)ppGpp synthase/HD superfamily hydrolase
MSILTASLSLLDQAIILATRAHAGQLDKGGAPYILHPLRVMLGCQTEEQRIAAVLHDTYEDGGITLEYIEEHFGKRIADAVDALSRRIHEGETYSEFIHRCGKNEIARVVKLEDLKDNMDETRLGRDPTEEDTRRIAKYAKARRTLIMMGATERRIPSSEIDAAQAR